MNPRSTAAALVVLGVVFIAINSRPAHQSTVGLLAGAAFVAAGVVRAVRTRRGDPPR